ncbi:flagellar biosynthetic protein FliO [Parahaliea mediterranea]|uniref:Flagellar protein n=1 Tax=Parahaliea mediterranea TaxID=651086 RepID=A0A939DDE0_9GAMM|nr:flagellar biosynthetic protein FliO [Parahaliea mediterranea]MBN7795836.1 flagellar biosynthetic protein FliO [Parahaliea mediterranea]
MSAAALPGAAAGGEAIIGLATLGKTAAALALIIALIFLCAALIKRLGPGRGGRPGALRVVTSTAVGTRERVVVVEVEGTWLVLGVASGQVNKLHSLPAPESGGAPGERAAPAEGGFPARFAQALKHNAGRTLGRGDSQS